MGLQAMFAVTGWKQMGISLLVALLPIAACNAHSQSLPLKAGQYSCHTITVTAHTQTAGEAMEEETWRKSGNPIRPMTVPHMLLAPAAFGEIILDGKGGYTMPAIKQTGRYGFDKAKGVPTFTGDLGAMQIVEYPGTGDRFSLGYNGMNFDCSLPAPPSAAVASGTRKPNAAFVRSAGPVRAKAVAADFDGQYIGNYVCSISPTPMQLDLSANTDGTLAGTVQFGGLHTPEGGYFLGSYSVKGNWKGTHYRLIADEWIKQPEGYVMIDFEGDLTTLGTSGVVLYSSCDSYALRRAR